MGVERTWRCVWIHDSDSVFGSCGLEETFLRAIVSRASEAREVVYNWNLSLFCGSWQVEVELHWCACAGGLVLEL